jgi:hypothetical protein
MRIRFIKHWRRGIKMDEVRDLPDGMANLLIKRRVAVAEREQQPELETACVAAADEAAVARREAPKRRTKAHA